MKFRAHKNHYYNVKLLRGYRASIALRNHKIFLKNGKDIFTGRQEVEEWFVTRIPYERIVIAGKGYVSTEAIQLLTEHNINVILLDSFGNLVCNMGRTTPPFRIAPTMEKEECKLALKMGKIASSYRIIVAFVIM